MDDQFFSGPNTVVTVHNVLWAVCWLMRPVTFWNDFAISQDYSDNTHYLSTFGCNFARLPVSDPPTFSP